MICQAENCSLEAVHKYSVASNTDDPNATQRIQDMTLRAGEDLHLCLPHSAALTRVIDLLSDDFIASFLRDRMGSV